MKEERKKMIKDKNTLDEGWVRAVEFDWRRLGCLQRNIFLIWLMNEKEKKVCSSLTDEEEKCQRNDCFASDEIPERRIITMIFSSFFCFSDAHQTSFKSHPFVGFHHDVWRESTHRHQYGNVTVSRQPCRLDLREKKIMITLAARSKASHLVYVYLMKRRRRRRRSRRRKIREETLMKEIVGRLQTRFRCATIWLSSVRP